MSNRAVNYKMEFDWMNLSQLSIQGYLTLWCKGHGKSGSKKSGDPGQWCTL